MYASAALGRQNLDRSHLVRMTSFTWTGSQASAGLCMMHTEMLGWIVAAHLGFMPRFLASMHPNHARRPWALEGMPCVCC